MSTERLYNSIEKCGPFQTYLLFFIQFTRFAAAWATLIMVFGNYDPGWTCIQNQFPGNKTAAHEYEQNNSKESQFNYSKFRNAFSDSAIKLHHAKYNFSSEVLVFNEKSTKTLINGTFCDTLDECDVIEFDPKSRTIVSEFNLICDQSFIPSIIISIEMVGSLVGVYVWGQLGEWSGRKMSLYSSSAVCSVSCFLAIFSSSWQLYAAFMFFVGFGAGGVFVLNELYAMEFLEPMWRGRLGGIPVWGFSVGLFAVAIFIIRDWVHIHIAAGCLNALACASVFWSPESVRWLLLHKKENKAKAVVQRIIRINKLKADIITDLMEEIPANDHYEQPYKKCTFLDLFRTRQIFSITIKISILLFFTLMTYYCLTFSVKTLGGNFYTNVLISGFSEIPLVVLTVAPMINYLGRRMTVSIFMSLGTVGCIMVVIAHFLVNEKTGTYIITYSALLAKASAKAYLNSFRVLTIELFPTSVRSLGTAFADAVGRIGTILAPFLISRDQTSLVITFIVLGLASFFNIMIIWSLTETNDKSLNDRLVDEKRSDQNWTIKGDDVV